MAANFVNVDLEITSSAPLEYLCSGMVDNGARKMYCGKSSHGRYLASFECDEHLSDPNSLIEIFVGMVSLLDDRAKSLWNDAENKIFDIGYEADGHTEYYQSIIKPETISRASEIGAGITITIYPKPN